MTTRNTGIIEALTPFVRIEDGIPIPQSKSARGRPDSDFQKTLTAMEVGQSFLVPEDINRSIVSSSLTYNAKKNEGRKYITRKVKEGVRVWRVQ